MAPGGAGPVLTGSGVSQLRHELRTPINAVLGYSEMLLEDAPAHASALGEAIAAGRAVLAAIEHALPATADAIDDRGIESLRAAIFREQQRIVRSMDAMIDSDPAMSPPVAADVARIREAAARLLAFDVPRLAEDPGLADDTVLASNAVTAGDTVLAARAGEGQTMIAEPALPPPEASASPESFRILVVDDVADNRAVLERRLEREGFQVQCAGDGREALERIRREHFDLILLDIMMPEIDGFEVLRRLKRTAATSDIPVIMISALDDLDSVVRCIEEGAEDHLPKPFEPVLLRARINASLEKKRLRDREKEYLAEVKTIAEAATAVEQGRYQPASLAEAALRSDELGRLARVFDGMAAQVKAREDRLRRQVNELRDEIEAVRRRGVATGPGESALPAGSLLADRYEIEMVVGLGAMGTVYRAFDRELGETVAVKALRPDLLADASVLARFKAEVRLARRITHPTVVRTHDLGEAGGVHYLTMEYVEGLTARALLDSRGRLGAAAVLALATQLAHGLAAAHAQGVIHRDIKPQNLLLDERGTLKIMDFGVSRLAGSAGGSADRGLLIGTPAYMAPEQLLGEEIDERADLYATGVVLFECLTGRLPFEAESSVALVTKVLRDDPPSASSLQPDVPPALSGIVTRLLARRRDERPATAEDLSGLLAQIG